MRYFKLRKLEFKQLIDDIAINLLSFRNFASMKDIKRKCNSICELVKIHIQIKKKNIE